MDVRRLIQPTLILGMLIALAACSSKATWKEEVQLSTGEVIVIDYEANFAGGGAAWPHGQGGIPREYIIRFKSPDQNGKLIEWRSSKLDSATYAESPVVLDRSNESNWFIFTVLPLSAVCDQYLKYEYKDGVWIEVPLKDDIGIYPTNLSLAAGSVDVTGLLTIPAKKVENSSIGFRSRLKQVGPKRFACNDTYTGPYPPRGAV